MGTKHGLKVEERFWLKVNKTEGCWLWTASTFPGGYAQFRTGVKGDSGSAARFSWELHYGPLDPGRRVVPICGNGLCVNPEHLAAGAEARFWMKVDRDGPIHPSLGQCWQWTGAICNKGTGAGYGNCIDHDGRLIRAHRFSYTIRNGAIPDDADIDHICRNRLCVRPEHLRAATRKQNAENRGVDRSSRTRIRGVYLKGTDSATGLPRYGVQVGHNGRKHFGGYFSDLELAEKAAVELRNRLFTHNDGDR